MTTSLYVAFGALLAIALLGGAFAWLAFSVAEKAERQATEHVQAAQQAVRRAQRAGRGETPTPRDVAVEPEASGVGRAVGVKIGNAEGHGELRWR